MLLHSSSAGLLAQTNADIRDAERRYREQKAREEHTRLPILLIDRLQRDLEEMNLRGMKRVPISYESRLKELQDQLGGLRVGPGDLENLKVKIGIPKLMDTLFAIQEAVLQERHGRAVDAEADELVGDLIFAA